MRFFRKHEGPEKFFRENTLDDAFAEMMVWIKDLSKKDYNKLKKAMDFDHAAYQALHGIEPDDGSDAVSPEFMLNDEEGR